VCKRARDGGKKQDVLGASCLWADIDIDVNGQSEAVVFELLGQMPDDIQPSIVVHSGGGLHLYWLLDKPVHFQYADTQYHTIEPVEEANTIMRDLVGGDNVQNVDRVMRLPGSYNNKRAGKKCRVLYCASHLLYDPKTLIDSVLRWGKVIDGDKWSKQGTVKKREAALAGKDPWDKHGHVFKGSAAGSLDKMWSTRVRQHAPRGYIGIHEAIIITTARLHCSEFPEYRIVEKVREWIAALPDADTSGWDWAAEERKIRDALRTWGPKWDAIRKAELKARREAKKNGQH
jgi:hypothetical protein